MSEDMLSLWMTEICVYFRRVKVDELFVTPAEPQQEQEQRDSENLKIVFFVSIYSKPAFTVRSVELPWETSMKCYKRIRLEAE